MSMTELPRICDVDDIEGKRVLVRASLNVPVENGRVRDSFRLMRSLATINYLKEKGAKVIVMGHIGRDLSETLAPVYRALSECIQLSFTGDIVGQASKASIHEMENGDIILLENVRSDTREQKNDPEFAAELAALADIYVNDAFADSHREHTSIVGVPAHLPSYVGVSFAQECAELENARAPKHPALFLLGGAKFDTKIPLVEKLLDVYDHIFIGGALAHDFFVAQGREVGQSLVSNADVAGYGWHEHEKILLPVDVTVTTESGSVSVKAVDGVTAEDRIVDCGPKTIAMLAAHISVAKTVLWNGPFGDYEHGFDTYTIECAKLVANASGYSVIGGGDTIASIASLNNQEAYDFLSTAGGAMMTYLETGTLAGIDAIRSAE